MVYYLYKDWILNSRLSIPFLSTEKLILVVFFWIRAGQLTKWDFFHKIRRIRGNLIWLIFVFYIRGILAEFWMNYKWTIQTIESKFWPSICEAEAIEMMFKLKVSWSVFGKLDPQITVGRNRKQGMTLFNHLYRVLC